MNEKSILKFYFVTTAVASNNKRGTTVLLNFWCQGKVTCQRNVTLKIEFQAEFCFLRINLRQVRKKDEETRVKKGEKD